MNDPQKYLSERLRMVEANNQLQRSALLNEEAARSRDLVTNSFLALQGNQSFSDVGTSSLVTTERYLLLQRLIEKHSMSQSSCPPLSTMGGLKFDATASSSQMPYYNPILSGIGALDPLQQRNLHFYEMNRIQQAGHGQHLSSARPNTSNASIVSKLAPNVSEKTSFPLPKMKTAPFKKLQLLSFRKAWSDLDHCPNNCVRKEIFSRRLYQNRHEIRGSTRSVIRQSVQKESAQL